MPADVTLIVDDKEYSGWKSISVTQGIEQMAGSFDLQVSERWPDQPTARQIKDGQECMAMLQGVPIINGYVDDVLPSYTASSHDVTITGRSRTADLVDCSAVYKTGSWKNKTLKQIATDLASHYDVRVHAEVDTGKAFSRFKIQEGETVFEALSRAAKLRGLLLISDAQGRLVITRAGNERISTPLVRGVNILQAEATISHRDRFRTYVVKAQSSGSAWGTAKTNRSSKFVVRDSLVTRNRTMIIVAEDQGDIDTCRKRATWERNTRAGQSRRANIIVNGWSHEDGVWEHNKLVFVEDDYLGISDELLIASVNFTFNESGKKTSLELVRREAFDVLKEPVANAGSGW